MKVNTLDEYLFVNSQFVCIEQYQILDETSFSNF